MPHPLLVNLPNLLSVSRVLLSAVMFWAVFQSYWTTAVAVLWLAVLTDLLDGLIARRLGAVTPLGGVLDHGSDAIFVTVTIAAGVTHGWAPAALVVMIPAAFLQYVLDSRVLKGEKLRASQLGRYNGISYFVFAGFPVMQIVLDVTIVPFHLFEWLGWGLVITTAISMADRAYSLLARDRERDPG